MTKLAMLALGLALMTQAAEAKPTMVRVTNPAPHTTKYVPLPKPRPKQKH